jgi:hypothetical protein
VREYSQAHICLQLQKVNKKSRRLRQNAKKPVNCLKSVKAILWF